MVGGVFENLIHLKEACLQGSYLEEALRMIPVSRSTLPMFPTKRISVPASFELVHKKASC